MRQTDVIRCDSCGHDLLKHVKSQICFFKSIIITDNHLMSSYFSYDPNQICYCKQFSCFHYRSSLDDRSMNVLSFCL